MLTLLAAVALNAIASWPVAADHELRRPVDLVSRTERRCPAVPEMTICTRPVDRPEPWRHVAEAEVREPAANAHVRNLRLQHARCAHPVDDALRCVKPVPFASMILGR